MNTNLEIEYKMLISEKQFEKLLQAYPTAKLIRQTNTYFRSANHDEVKCSIRIRQIGSTYLFTLKIPQKEGLLEKETEVSGNHEEDLHKPEILNCFSEYGIKGPFICEGQLTTERYLIKDEYGELCIDKNTYFTQTDYELEYEISTDPQMGLKHFSDLLLRHGIEYVPNSISKHARCIAAAKAGS